jgi:chromosome segregation protein
MKIKRLEITGFKSFVESTSLVFDEGITTIVGPNGCGKSNLVDAIRWVMGEQSARNLRGKSMEDVIFGGSESRKPLGMAEVTLILDNTAGQAPPAYRDYAEIQVTRRLHRNGDSEYLLNKTPCRLLDITELFMDTGVGSRAYSIIEQGKIGMIVNAKPEDRRYLVEEAAGVTKYKARKKTALRKIEATRQNLLRLGDIIAEVKRQVNSLKRQAKRAERFREYREELKGVDLQFALRQYGALIEQCRQAGLSTEGKAGQVEHLARKLEMAELDLAQARLHHTEREEEASRGQEQAFHLTSEIQKIESRLEFGSREMESLAVQKERFATEWSEIDRQLSASEKEERTLQETREGLGRELLDEQQRLAETEQEMVALEERERALHQQLEEARSQLYSLLTELSRMGGQQEEADRRLHSLAGSKERNNQEAVAVRAQLDRLQADTGDLSSNLTAIVDDRNALLKRRQSLREDITSFRQGVEDVEAKLLVKREALSRQASRLESLEQLELSLEGYGRGVKALLSRTEQKNRLLGVVADVLDVPPDYEIAVEAVLGSRLQTLLTEQVESVEEAFAFLRREEGRCTFLLPGFTSVQDDFGTVGTPLSELVSVRAGCERQVRSLLAGVFLVDDLQSHLSGGFPAGMILVTPGGDVLTGRGEMTGGGRQSLDQGLLHKKREMKELGSQVQDLKREVDALGGRREQLRADLLLEILSFEEDQLHDEQDRLVSSLEEARTGRAAVEQAKLDQEAVVTGLNGESQSMRLRADEARQRLTARKVALVSLQERDEGLGKTLERIRRTRLELQQRQNSLVGTREEAEERKAVLGVEAGQLKTELEVLFARRVEKQAELSGLKDRFEESRQDIERRETEIKLLRVEVNQAREELSSGQLQNRELSLETEHLRQAFLDRYRVDLEDEAVAARFEAEFDQQAAEKRREFLHKRIEEIGEVNLTAIDEFRELEERYLFLTTQQEDLQRSLEGLQAAISKINRTTRKRFREAFDLINTKFRETFPQMFNGGQAELRLTDEDDILETGIDIVAQPPGKKLQNVSLLSGGEKALTAVALIFSIFQVKPSPFCLLDEVDAPLDDMNIGRFNEVVNQMTTDSQFIIITHNKRTMEIADSLYGVTMEDPGISKLVSVRMREAA